MRSRHEGGVLRPHGVPGYSINYDETWRQDLTGQSPFTIWYSVYDNVMVDDPVWRRITLPDGSKITAFKDVTHVRRSGNFEGAKLSYRTPSPPSTVSDVDSRMNSHWVDENGRRNIWEEAFNALAQAIPASNPTSGHYDRWQKVKPGMSTRANMAVFLAELRDVKRMFEILPDRHFHLNDWKEVLKYANGQHLNYNFGWKPFLRDLWNFKQAKESFDRRLRSFMRNENLVVKRGTGDQPVVGSSTAEWVSDTYWTNRRFFDWNIERRSSFQYVYSYPHYSQTELLWRAWADSFGLNPSLKNIWAIMPWSFVVDWFADVSGFLSQADHPWLEPWVDLIQGCSTEKISAGMRWITIGPSSWGSPTGPVCDIQFSSFKRVVGAPNFQWDAQTLNADKIRLLASLVAGRLL